VLSQKGGTGKTTTVRTLTDVLRRCGVSTLAVDLDPQATSRLLRRAGRRAADDRRGPLGQATAAEAIHEGIIRRT